MGTKAVQTDENVKLQRLIEVDKKSLPPDGGPGYNRLIFARSPYLLQHAKNPVDWYQWGDDAFARAANENKPLFLSIGYATCHWCHVMEHESFEDVEVAAVLNRHFISIKVDREERPDVDDQYMTAAQMLKGGGGWPLNVFLTPERRPFHVVTYVPKTAHHGTTGFVELLEKIADVWKNQRDLVETSCASIIQNLAESAEPKPAPIPGGEILEGAYQHLEMMYDRVWGGFGSAPKFPRPLFLSYLLRFWKRKKHSTALGMVEHSLGTMRKGGIYDQVGFGFHRYSVDESWLVPHFEKMLYDQAILAMTYLEAFQATGNVDWKGVAEEIFEYVGSEMASPLGGFYSARDADTEGVEGKYYIWTPAEVNSILGRENARVACDFFDISDGGNFEGENILHLDMGVKEFAEREGINADAFRADLENWRKKLLSARGKRTKPLRDEKILTSWNGLMIAALARGFAVTGEGKLLTMAENAVKFIRERLVAKDGRLLRSHYLGESTVQGFLEDYAFFVWGLVELYEATLDPEYLNSAVHLNKETLRLFVDEHSYGLFDTGFDAENVLVRKKSIIDGVVPSGNSVAAMNFLKLGKIKASRKFVKEGEGILRSMMGDAQEHPLSCLYSLMALDYLHGPDVDVTLVGDVHDPVMKDMLCCLSKRFIPHLVLRTAKEDGTSGYRTLAGKPAAYVCHAGTCRPPVSGGEALGMLLNEMLGEREVK
jgi:uncharacterized protein YyaL (SSP411 family)